MTANDLWKAIKSYWEGKRIEFLTKKTKEMKQVATVKVNEDVAHHPLTKKEKERKLDVKELKKV